jgi:lipid II:glycine glycyltransferase (peptidoglycan interpeptide bridge formation enzyme)
MADGKMRALHPDYTSEIDCTSEQAWCGILQDFDDANIYQTWSYGEVTSGARNISHLTLRKNGQIIAAAQVRIAKIPLLRFGIAYVQWGPLWRHSASRADTVAFGQILRALRNEFVCKRGLILRIFPILFSDDASLFSEILTHEGFLAFEDDLPGRTILIDLNHSLDEFRDGLGRNWKRNLKAAEGKTLEILEGSEDKLFESFIEIYEDMVSRKKFPKPNDINQYRIVQARSPEKFRMKIMLCKSEGRPCAGLIWSELGKMGIELFAATNGVGTKTKGSFLLRWKLVEGLKNRNIATYNLNGINPVKNPGGYKFKTELAGKNGRDVFYLGKFDSSAGVLNRFCVEQAESLRKILRRLKSYAKSNVTSNAGIGIL